MRWLSFTVVVAFAVALSAAVIGDAVTEMAANLLAGHAVDAHHESLLPAGGIAALLVAVVCGFAVAAGRAQAEAFAGILSARPIRIGFFVATAMLTLAIVVAMEGYETRFGGMSAFDARSVLAQYMVPTLLAYACVAAAVDRLLRVCVRAALAGWEAVMQAAAPSTRRRLALLIPVLFERRDERSIEAVAGRTHPSWSLRAPPVLGQFLSAALIWRAQWKNFLSVRACARSF
jgi:hypothetical protein